MFTISLSPAMPAFLSRNCKVYIAHVAISTKCSHLFASTDAFFILFNIHTNGKIRK